MWGNVAMDVAIMGFGATYAWLENYAYMDYSLPYFRSSVRCLTPQPQKLPGWMTPVLPFSPRMWIAVGISMLITTASIYIVTRLIMALPGKFPHHSSNNLRTALPTVFTTATITNINAVTAYLWNNYKCNNDKKYKCQSCNSQKRQLNLMG
jgi:hypothetical protein